MKTCRGRGDRMDLGDDEMRVPRRGRRDVQNRKEQITRPSHLSETNRWTPNLRCSPKPAEL